MRLMLCTIILCLGCTSAPTLPLQGPDKRTCVLGVLPPESVLAARWWAPQAWNEDVLVNANCLPKERR